MYILCMAKTACCLSGDYKVAINLTQRASRACEHIRSDVDGTIFI
jgi:hypothetical protein